MQTHHAILITSQNNPDKVIELLPALLTEIGFEGFVELENGLQCYIPSALWNSETEVHIASYASLIQCNDLKVESVEQITPKNWNEEWERSIQPINVTDSIIIAPSWHPQPSREGKINITIDPKMTFGTGYHETTRLMLLLMERWIPAHASVLDVGTGTGILAIAAIKLGAATALGIDTDVLSLDNGIENSILNGVEKTVEIRIGSLECVHESQFDIIVANIIKNTILELLPEMAAKLASNGILLLSGLLQQDEEDIINSLQSYGLMTAETVHENEWIAIAARRKP